MKKFFVFLFVLVLSIGFVAAEDIGLTVGADFSVGNVTKADDGEWEPILMPMVYYEKSFDALDFSTELDYYFDFTPNFEDLSQYLDFDLTLGYTLSLGSASTLLLEVDNLFESFAVSPRHDGIYATLTPRVRFTQETDIGNLYAQVTAPIGYLDNDGVLLRSRLGWNSGFGLGLWAQLDSSLVPDVIVYNGMRANVSYEADAFSFDVTARVFKELSTGITISPNFDLYFGAFDFNVYCDFEGIAADGGSMTISPGLGFYYSF